MDTISENLGAKPESNELTGYDNGTETNSFGEARNSVEITELTELTPKEIEQSDKSMPAESGSGAVESLLADIQKFIPEEDKAMKILEEWANDSIENIELYAANPQFIPQAVEQYSKLKSAEEKLAKLQSDFNTEVMKRTTEGLLRIKNMNYSDLGVSVGGRNTELQEEENGTLKRIINRNI